MKKEGFQKNNVIPMKSSSKSETSNESDKLQISLLMQMKSLKEFIYQGIEALECCIDSVKVLCQNKGIFTEREYTLMFKERTEELERIKEAMQDRNENLITKKDGVVESKDIVVVDFQGSIDGKVFPAGVGKMVRMPLDEGKILDEFNDALKGKKVGDEFEIDAVFPQKYHREDLAGKKVHFKVRVRRIKQRGEKKDDSVK